MSPMFRSRAWPALLFAPIISLSAGAQSSRGITGNLTMTLVPPSLGGASAGSTTLAGTAFFVSGKGRIDIARGSGPAIDYREGDYVLLGDSGRVTYLRPSSKEMWTMDSPFLSPFSQLLANAGQIGASGGNVTMEGVGDGDSVSGFATHRFRIDATYTINAGTTSIPAGMTIEITVARTGAKFASAPLAGAQTFGVASAPGLMPRIYGYLTQIGAEGIIVRGRGTSWFTFNGTTINTTVTSELTNLKEADIETAKLTMPAGFRQGG